MQVIILPYFKDKDRNSKDLYKRMRHEAKYYKLCWNNAGEKQILFADIIFRYVWLNRKD